MRFTAWPHQLQIGAGVGVHELDDLVAEQLVHPGEPVEAVAEYALEVLLHEDVAPRPPEDSGAGPNIGHAAALSVKEAQRHVSDGIDDDAVGQPRQLRGA